MKIFTTVLTAILAASYPPAGLANYRATLTEYPVRQWTIALIGGASHWPNIHAGCPGGQVFAGGVTGVSLTTDTAGTPTVTTDTLVDIRGGCYTSGWQLASFTLSNERDYPPGTLGSMGSFYYSLWTEGPNCNLDDLKGVQASVVAASPLQATPGAHHRQITVELVADTSNCSVITLQRDHSNDTQA
ncbi:hypothetical protein LJZ95_003160 [Salmonella enterica]|nr:hypothetical protein [Salmonella enterica]